MKISFKITCKALGIPQCQTEYENWLQWFAGSSSIAAPVQTHPQGLQPYEGIEISNGAPARTTEESMETLNVRNITEEGLPLETTQISLDSRDERRRSQPREFDGYPGNFVGLEVYTVELLCTLENYIAIPLSNLSLMMSHFAYLHILHSHSGEPEGQHEWLECYETLANQVCEDLVGCSFLYVKHGVTNPSYR